MNRTARQAANRRRNTHWIDEQNDFVGEEVEDVLSEEQASTTVLYLPAAILLLLALPFGSVHEGVRAITTIFICMATFFLMYFSMRNRKEIFRTPSLNALLVAIVILTTYVAIHSASTDLLLSHPLREFFSKTLFTTFCNDFLAPLVLFVSALFLSYLSFRSESKKMMIKNYNTGVHAFILSSALISVIALAHWFTDNGKLFWVFSPQFEFISPRARWPLVNSNHLGFLLIPGFLFAFSALASALTNLYSYFIYMQPQLQKKGAIPLFSRREVHTMLAKNAYMMALTLMIGSALLATLSRSVSAAALIGMVGVVFLHQRRFAHRKKRKDGRLRKKTKRVSLPLKSLLLSVCVAFLAISLIILFFGLGSGQELYLQRLAFGLLYTHQDMRWQMFADSLQLLSFWGIGVSQWSVQFPMVANIGMAGFSPRYLHSDPFQFLIEFGVPGALLLLGVVGAIFYPLAKSLSFKPLNHEKNILLLVLAVLCIPIATDFSLRIPVNLVMLAMIIGFGFALIDSKADERI